MDSNVSQRKRGGRLAKNTNVNEKSSSGNEFTENSAIAISPTLDEAESANNAPASECRRSSRKKIIKFDVRDLLNKNRKTHKIQIEARIDSNAPTTSKAASVGGAAAANLKTSTSREDLLSKHKTFLEKSAIFRRYSISQEQKPPPPLPLPPLLGKSSENKESSFCGTSSSQEFLSHALIKPKEPTSLIVAQIESNKPISANLTKRKTLNNSEILPIVQQKKRGRPAKNKTQTSEEIVTVEEVTAITNITPEKAKNWKEYKACLAQKSSSSKEEKTVVAAAPQNKIQMQTLIRKQVNLNESLQLDISRSDDDGSFSGFQIGKDDLSCDSPVLEKIAAEKEISMENVLSQTVSNDNIVGRDKNTIKENLMAQKAKPSKRGTTNDKNKALFAEEDKVQETTEISDKEDLEIKKVVKQTKTKEGKRVVKSIEKEEDLKINTQIECVQEEKACTVTLKAVKIETSSKQEIEITDLNDIKQVEKQTMLESKCNKTTIGGENFTSPHITETVKIKNLKSCDISAKDEEDNKLEITIEESALTKDAKQSISTQSSTTLFESKTFSRASSPSGSENASEFSSSSSDPFSTTSSSSQRSYKSGDNLKVSIKRISLPKSPTTSSQTSTSDEINSADITKRKPLITKHTKRLLKKFGDSLNTENNSDNNDVQLKLSSKPEDDLLDPKISVENTQTRNLTNLINENTSKLISPESLVRIDGEPHAKETNINTDESSLGSNGSSNVSSLPEVAKNIKRKSLRNRKDNSSLKKYDDTEKTKFEETQKPLEKEIVDKEQETAQECIGKLQENVVIDEKNFVCEKSSTSYQTDQPEDTKQRKNTRKSQQNKKQFEKSTVTEKEMLCKAESSEKEKSKIETEDLTNPIDSSKDFLNKEKSMINTPIPLKNQTVTDLIQTKSKKSSEDETDYKAESNSKDTNLTQIQAGLKGNEELSTTPAPQPKEHLKVETDSTENKLENQNKKQPIDKKSTETVSANNKPTTTGKTNKIEIELKTSYHQPDSLEKKSTKRDVDNKATSKQNKLKKEESSAKQLKNIEEEISLLNETATKKEVVKNKDIKELTKVKIVESTSASNKSSKQKSIKSKVENVTDIKIDVVGVKEDTNQADVEAEVELPPGDNSQNKKSNCEMAQENDEVNKIEVDNCEPKAYVPLVEKHVDLIVTSEMINAESSNSKQAESKMQRMEAEIVLENVTSKSEKIKESRPTHTATQQNLNKEQITPPKISNTKEICATAKTLKGEKQTKHDISTKLLTETLEAREVEISKTQDKNLDLEVSQFMSTSKQGLKNVIPLPKTRESIEKNSPVVLPKRMTSKRITNSPKILVSENPSKFSTEFFLPVESSKAEPVAQILKPHSAEKLTAETPSVISLTKTDDTLKPLELSKQSSEASLDDAIHEITKCSSNTRPQISKVEGKEQILAGSSVPKRRGRKPRFKNLHGPEDSETDSSNGKITPINEQKCETKLALQENLGTQIKKTQEDLNALDMTVSVQDDNKPELSTSQIKNVSIETNTLLDILRRVQSNTAAALKANQSPTNIESTSNEPLVESTSKANIEASAKSTEDLLKMQQNETSSTVSPVVVKKLNEPVVESNSKANIEASAKSSEDLLKIQQSETSSTVSPVVVKKLNEPLVESISKANIEASAQSSEDLLKMQQNETSSTVSTVVVKKLNLSPVRSDSNSPLTLKKVTVSPTNSNSSSPLTLKKATRRYERRSHRGEDSSHKTLEETFAEIAAQSSKAVLAAKEFEEKSPEDLDTTSTAVITEKYEVQENLADIERVSAPAVTDLNVDKDIKDDNVLLEIPLDKAKEAVVANEKCDDTMDQVVSVNTGKTTPTRRGRKPKNRHSEITGVSKEEEEFLNPTNLESKDEEKDIQKLIETEVETKKDSYENKQDSVKVEESFEICLNENSSDNKEKISSPVTTATTETSLPLHIEEPIQHTEDITENKHNKKSNKKRETKVAIEEDNSISTTTTDQEKSDEIRTPKQPMKKRDSSLSKGETKSGTKKLSKKVKNEEEDSLNLAKEDTLVKSTPTTTPSHSKRGRKPKNPQPETPQSSSKKKTKKDNYIKKDGEDAQEGDKAQLSLSECESSINSSIEKCLDEKLAKKKRQRKLKEAFEAALTDNKEKNNERDTFTADSSSPTINSNLGLEHFDKSPPPERRESVATENQSEIIKLTCLTPVVTEEDPDPLKDIEKFIADGVNLLKKDYKLDENSVDDVIQTTPPKATNIVEEIVEVKAPNDDDKTIFHPFETPADTPINTPSVTPPPKSPSSLESTTPDENSGVRRSHRIKLITQTPKALVGRGLVRDRERFSIKDDVETKRNYTLDDHLTDLAEVEAKNAKFLKEMEERLSNFSVIKVNDYLCERVISREARKMICDCFLTHVEEDRGELGCGEDCLNRLLMIECGPECNVKERCTNKRFQKLLCSPCRVFRTEKKGFGIMADIEILPGEFIMEYVGEVIDTEEFENRRIMYSQEKNRHYYFMALRSDAIIDATSKGNISRFINHSCDPNAETQKWTVNGELRIGFFSRKSIMPGEEITFNYQYKRYGRAAQRCYCESSNCTGWIGQEPTSDEGEQLDDEDDETEDEDEAVTSNLLDHDDEDDSDASVADPEEVQKQLEMAAAQAEVELAPLQLIREKDKQVEPTLTEGSKALQDFNKSDNEEDSKSKFKKLLSKMAEKVAAKQKQSKREQKLQRKNKSKETSSELATKLKFLEDPDIEDEVRFLKECGLKNQSDTLRLSRLMVRAKLVQTRLNLLEILRKGDLPCRRLFLDYHGLRLLHGWMSEDAGNMQIRLSVLQTLETLPIANKNVLNDSKVMQVVRTWSGPNSNLSPNEDSSSSNSNSQDLAVPGSTTLEENSEVAGLQKLATKLITNWESLPEIFRIPKKERIEQMKEHEREADRQYAASAEIQENTTATDRYRRDRFGRGLNTPSNSANGSNRFTKPNPHKTANTTPENLKNLSKAQRREMFAAKVARDEAEKRLAEERREFETKCRFFGLDPKKTHTQDLPFCVNPATAQWFSIERKPITTPPSYAHLEATAKPKSTDPKDYQLPAVCSTLPPQWKYAITTQGKIYYYHIKHRLSQWEPPSTAQLQQCELEAREEESENEFNTTAGEDSSDDEDDILIGMDAVQLKAYIDRKVEMRRQKRYIRLVDERAISPRREEDRIYNQIEVRKYKENKEKIRKRKEDIRRKRAEALRQTSLNLCTLGSITDAIPSTSKANTESDEELGALPIQDYLLSSDEEIDIKAEINSPLLDKIVEGDKIVDELDALTIKKRHLKRTLPPHRDLSEASTSSSSVSALIATTLAAKQEYKKRKLEKKEKRKPKEQDAKYRKNKEKFRCEIAGIIVHHLKPYLKETCTRARIQSNEDFNHLARKLTHFVMIKELKYCESVGQTLVVTESVKSKSREFIKKYMAKYSDVYVKPINDPDFKDIPFTL